MLHSASKQNFAVVILAAGKSERMGTPKAALKLADGRTFLQSILETYLQWGVGECILVVNESFQLECVGQVPLNQFKIVVNPRPDRGRNSSIHLGIEQTFLPFVFIQNIDNPLINSAILDSLMPYITKDNYCTPVYCGKGGHPLLISRKMIIANLEKFLNAADLKTFLAGFERVKVSVDSSDIHRNINSLDDYTTFINQITNENSNFIGFDTK